MGLTYEQAPPEAHAVARELFEEHHADLRMGGHEEPFPRLCIMLVGRDDGSEEPPLKVQGYAAAAVISIIPLKQRADKRADAEVLLDRAVWEGLSDRRRAALLDHEITHLEIVKDENGFVRTDDVGRPKLKLRLHDWQLGGFRAIAERHGEDACEVREARAFIERFGGVVQRDAAPLFVGA